MDVKSTFLYRVLKKEVYIKQPLGYEAKEHEDRVLKLKKALYRLKKTLGDWNIWTDKYF